MFGKNINDKKLLKDSNKSNETMTTVRVSLSLLPSLSKTNFNCDTKMYSIT